VLGMKVPRRFESCPLRQNSMLEPHRLEKFNKFLKTVDLKDYREKYSSLRIVEMDLPKDVQAVELLYKVYWDEKKFISFDDFYNRYLQKQKNPIENFRKKTTMCKDCYYRGLKARIYRT